MQKEYEYQYHFRIITLPSQEKAGTPPKPPTTTNPSLPSEPLSLGIAVLAWEGGIFTIIATGISIIGAVGIAMVTGISCVIWAGISCIILPKVLPFASLLGGRSSSQKAALKKKEPRSWVDRWLDESVERRFEAPKDYMKFVRDMIGNPESNNFCVQKSLEKSEETSKKSSPFLCGCSPCACDPLPLALPSTARVDFLCTKILMKNDIPLKPIFQLP